MASILDKYGIKEVADVMFYEIDDNGQPSTPVLYLDTLKVSTIEQTAEEAIAKGGKGNAPLITWDYGKDINVTLEDALFSAKSMAIMFGNGTVTSESSLKKTIAWRATSTANVSTFIPSKFEGPQGKTYDVASASERVTYDATGSTVAEDTAAVEGGVYYTTFDIGVTGSTIDISANSFPGTYYVTGDTYARSEMTGNDEFFQFIIPKAKVKSENTITLEAEGDPSVFNLSLHVLRPAGGGAMMKLVKYDITQG